MVKQLQFATLISCISISSYAYVIGTNFTVTNNTDTLMTMEIKPPKGQDPIHQKLPAHHATTIYLENGDHTGLFYQPSAATFTVKANDKLYAQGRIAFYVGASLWRKYSFLDSISSADNIKIEPTYSCWNGGNNTLNNAITISGTATSELQPATFSNNIQCQGFKSSRKEENTDYVITCMDNNTARFWRSTCTDLATDPSGILDYCYRNKDYFYSMNYDMYDSAAQSELDSLIGRPYCQNWSKSL